MLEVPKNSHFESQLQQMEFRTFQGEDVVNSLPVMHHFCADRLRGYPYFYSPPFAQIINPTDTIYVNEKDSHLVIVKEEERVIGMAAGLPMSSFFLGRDYFSFDLVDRFRAKGLDPEKIWYVGYFLLSQEARMDKEIVDAIYQSFIQHAKSLNKTWLCFVDVQNPRSAAPHEEGFHPEPWREILEERVPAHVSFKALWPTIQTDGSVKEEEHTIEFFLSKLP